MGFSRQEYWSRLPFPSPGDLPDSGIKPRSSALWADSLPSEPPGKPKNSGVGSLSLLQGIFLTQELNRGLLHCRRIFYQLSYQGFPGGSDSKESACTVPDLGSISGLGRSPGEENDNTLQYSCLENPMDGGSWQATVHGVTWGHKESDMTEQLTLN